MPTKLRRKADFFILERKKSLKPLHNSQKSSYLCPVFQGDDHRRDGRVVDYSGLENRRAERHRGFESLALRVKYSVKGVKKNFKNL